MIHLPEFKDNDELFSYLRKNKSILKIAKKAEKKEWCGVYDTGNYNREIINIQNPCFDVRHKSVTKDQTTELLSLDSVPSALIINTTNIRDSHKDVHMPGTFTKTMKEGGFKYLLKQHKMNFEDIISHIPNPSLDMMSWKDLGFNYEGQTQALVFNTLLEKERHEFMFEQYMKGYVKNHSVAMMYVTLYLCMNSDSKYDKEEKDNWDKYQSQVVNLNEFKDEEPYFWAVTEAKGIEGSAVPLGSNFATPVYSIGAKSLDNSRQSDTVDEPVKTFNWGNVATAISKINN